MPKQEKQNLNGEIYDYDFQAVNPSQYECKLDLKVKNRLLLMIFQKSKTKLERKGVHTGLASPEEINGFEVDPRFYKLLGTIAYRLLKKVEEEVKKDGIKVLTSKLTKAYFLREKKTRDWVVTMIYGGDYVDER